MSSSDFGVIKIGGDVYESSGFGITCRDHDLLKSEAHLLLGVGTLRV